MSSSKKRPTRAIHDIALPRTTTYATQRPPLYLIGAFPSVGHRLLTRSKFPMQKPPAKRKLSLEPNIHGSKGPILKQAPSTRVNRDVNLFNVNTYTSSLKRQLMRSASTNLDFKPIFTERNLSSSKRQLRLSEYSTNDVLGSASQSRINPVSTFDPTIGKEAENESFDESLACLIKTLEDCVAN
mmetsp:Transcript_31398/g.54473  ORF Transcript_31398/g.54473 Transcript_31398/m.54473 type:complete len:184 (+) Transcript_31398:127-678(+)